MHSLQKLWIWEEEQSSYGRLDLMRGRWENFLWGQGIEKDFGKETTEQTVRWLMCTKKYYPTESLLNGRAVEFLWQVWELPGKHYFSVNSEALWQKTSTCLSLGYSWSTVTQRTQYLLNFSTLIILWALEILPSQKMVCFWEPEDNRIIIETPKLLVKNLATVSHCAGS